MPERAHVTSVEALEDFRASLIVYLSKARPTLDEVSSDVRRLRDWVENDRRSHWENQVRRRTKEFQKAQQAVFSASLSDLRGSSDAEQLALQRARRALEEAQAKLKRIAKWSREFDSHIDPQARQLDHLRNILAIDMPKATAHLAQVMKTLADYADLGPSWDAAGLSQPHEPNTAKETGAPSGEAGSAPPGETP